MSESYAQVRADGKRAHVKVASVDKLKRVDAVIFDCDGVLIDVRESYNRAIQETVAYIVKEATGLTFSRDGVPREVIHLFKKSGGFNNDWDLAYAVAMFIFSRLPNRFREALRKRTSANRYKGDPAGSFLSVKDGIQRECGPIGLNNGIPQLELELKKFAKTFDVSGIASIEKKLSSPSGTSKDTSEYYAALKRFFSYPGAVGESLLTTVFEEIFCGSQLFREMYKREPAFFRGKGAIENERVILLPESLDQLASVLGSANFGVSSGRPFNLALYTLNGLLERFNPEALFFLDRIEAAERENAGRKGSCVRLKKPNPFSLLESSRAFEPFRFALYVGDSVEDVIMVKEANGVDSRFLFAGVHGHSDCQRDLLRSFLEMGSDIVLPSVNELPVILKRVKEEREV